MPLVRLLVIAPLPKFRRTLVKEWTSNFMFEASLSLEGFLWKGSEETSVKVHRECPRLLHPNATR